MTEQLSSRFAELSDTIKANEKRMVEIGALQTHINNYSRTRSVYEAYRKSGYSIKFFEEHREEIQIHKAAKKAFDQLPGKKVPTRQSLNEEYHRLLSGKKEAYAEYRQVKKDMQEFPLTHLKHSARGNQNQYIVIEWYIFMCQVVCSIKKLTK